MARPWRLGGSAILDNNDPHLLTRDGAKTSLAVSSTNDHVLVLYGIVCSDNPAATGATAAVAVHRAATPAGNSGPAFPIAHDATTIPGANAAVAVDRAATPAGSSGPAFPIAHDATTIPGATAVVAVDRAATPADDSGPAFPVAHDATTTPGATDDITAATDATPADTSGPAFPFAHGATVAVRPGAPSHPSTHLFRVQKPVYGHPVAGRGSHVGRDFSWLPRQ